MRHSLLGSSCSRPGTGPSLRSADRARPARPDPDGVSTFRTSEIRPGWVPPLPRGRRCSSWPDAVPGRRLPLPSGQSLHPAANPISGAPQLRGINERSRDSPVRPAPCLWPPGWDGRSLGFPLCSAPRRYRRRTTGRGRASNYATGITGPPIREFPRKVRPRVATADADVRTRGATPGQSGRRRLNNGVHVQLRDVTNADDYDPNFVHCPSETTSTKPSSTLMAVCSSMA